MARFLSNVPMKKLGLMLPLPAATFFIAFIGILSVFSIVTFLCSSHKRAKKEKSTMQLGERKPGLSKLGSSISSKAFLMAKMVSWRKVHDDEEDAKEGGFGDGNEEAVWKRTIIMGERCQPVDFSGRILYDSQGNLLPETPPSKRGNGGKSAALSKS